MVLKLIFLPLSQTFILNYKLSDLLGFLLPPLVLKQIVRPDAPGAHDWTEGATQPIQVVEERFKVGLWLQVMHVVFWGPSQPSERQMIEREREVVADMRLDAHDDGEDHVTPRGQRVAVEKPRVGGGQETNRNELPRMEVLRDPTERRGVAVVQSVYVLVQEPYFVVCPVPDVVLNVEYDETCKLVPNEFEQCGGYRRKYCVRRPYPLSTRSWQNIQDMVPERDKERVPEVIVRDVEIGLDLEGLKPLPLFSP